MGQLIYNDKLVKVNMVAMEVGRILSMQADGENAILISTSNTSVLKIIFT